MEIKVIHTVAYQVITPVGNRRCFTTEGAYRALAKRMIKNHRRWQCQCVPPQGNDLWDMGYICYIHDSEELYIRKCKLQDRLVRWLKYSYPPSEFAEAAA